jgi:hypothetical protein
MRESCSAFVMNNKGYITGGTYSSLLTDTWEYESTTDLWIRKTSFEGPARSLAVAFVLNNRGFVLTGSNGSSYFDDIWEFQPDAEVNEYDN